MKIQSLYNAFLGIATEIVYAIVIILAAFLVCIAAYFLKL
jgi:branched-subunit amino acid ABC-type transport system permease component